MKRVKLLNHQYWQIGLIVNPIAGMGGLVGLKGTDGPIILQKALRRGAKPVAPQRATRFLQQLQPIKEKITLLVGAGEMGEVYAREQGFNLTVLGTIHKRQTTAQDTKDIVKEMLEREVKLVIFCGGDGTARDILDSIDQKVPILGVPTGVKMQSAVFAIDPSAAARITLRYIWSELPLKETEIMDIDEEDFRKGHLSAKLYGYAITPFEPALIQGSKIASMTTNDELRNQAAVAIYIIEEMQQSTLYIIGPGTTTRTIGDLLDQKKTLLGVDLFFNKQLLASDVTETTILEEISNKPVKIIVTPIGGQGFIFGRGNQPISSRVIQHVGKANIIVIATKNKIRQLSTLRVDTGDPEVDDAVRGYIRVITDYREEHVMKVE
jgi:predicted polyphosphate/ATP-dependent NAD kinase